MSKPMEYRLPVTGFGTWRITYTPSTRRWALDYNVRAVGEQWVPADDYPLAETASLSVAERKTGVRSWDGLRFTIPPDASSLSSWQTEASDGVQVDAGE